MKKLVFSTLAAFIGLQVYPTNFYTLVQTQGNLQEETAVFCIDKKTVRAGGHDSLLLVQQRQTQKIDSFINALNKKGRFNGSIVVTQNGNILYEKHLGIAYFSTGDSIKSDHTYQLASVSKSITSAAIMMLYQQGQIDLEDKISKYIPELALYHTVKVKHLLNHTSGIPEYIYRFASNWKKDQYMTNNDLVGLYSRKKFRLSFTPGTRYSYCNTNYALLATIVERVADQPFDDYVKLNIFDPLGMCNSYVFNPAKDTVACRMIRGYQWNGRRYVEFASDYRNGVMGDKGIFSSARDLAKFEQIISSNVLLTPETIKRTLTKTTLKYGQQSEYACGWRIRQIDSMQAVLHYGFWNSFRTGLICFPESHTTFVILNNTTGNKNSAINNRDEIINELISVLFPRKQTFIDVITETEPEHDPVLPIEGDGDGEIAD